MSSESLHIVHKLDKKSFEELFKTYFSQLTYYAQRYVKDHDTSKEIVHDVFINLWEKRETIDLKKKVKSYLYTSVHNRCLNYIRDNKKFDQNITEIENINIEGSWDDSDKLIQYEIEDRIQKTLDSLPEKCREVFTLSRFENLKYGEIAEKLNISVKTVEAQMSKALKIFREGLKEYLTILILFFLNG